jgi:hypothetical protein
MAIWTAMRPPRPKALAARSLYSAPAAYGVLCMSKCPEKAARNAVAIRSASPRAAPALATANGSDSVPAPIAVFDMLNTLESRPWHWSTTSSRISFACVEPIFSGSSSSGVVTLISVDDPVPLGPDVSGSCGGSSRRLCRLAYSEQEEKGDVDDASILLAMGREISQMPNPSKLAPAHASFFFLLRKRGSLEKDSEGVRRPLLVALCRCLGKRGVGCCCRWCGLDDCAGSEPTRL